MSEEKEVGDSLIVEIVGHARQLAQTFDGVADDEPRSDLGVKRRPDPEVIAGADKTARPRVPDCKREIAEQMVHAGDVPFHERPQDERGVRSCCRRGDRWQGT